MSARIERGAVEPSLRERRRMQTRHLIAQVALDRFERQGFKATTVEEIADEVGIASRTFFRYYSSKDEVLFGWHRYAVDTIAAQPIRSGSPAQVLAALQDDTDAFLMAADTRPGDVTRLFVRVQRLLLRDPDLRATESTQLAGLAAGLEARVRAALGPHADDLLVRLVLQVYGACLTSALEVWLGTAEAPLPADLVALHRRARRQLSTLLVEPRPPTSLSAIDPMNAQVAGL